MSGPCWSATTPWRLRMARTT
jgi:hypothetical protein